MEGRRRNTSNNYNNNKNNDKNNNNNNYRERCLTMHQPWASLLVHGIKRIEGRSWPSPLTGRLWIHAASKVPENAIIKTMEEFYREIYARDGITDLEFPQNYPVSRLVGCVEVVGYLTREELARWKEVPEGVRLEALTDFCWLCEHPQKLPVPLEMGGWRGVYDLDGKMSEAAIGSLVRAESPLPLKFPLPNPQDPSSLRPGSISPFLLEPEVELSPKLKAAIDAASQAATQFSNKGQSSKGNSFDSGNKGNFTRSEDSRFIRNNQYSKDYHFDNRNRIYFTRPAAAQYVKKEQNMGKNGVHSRSPREDLSTQLVQKSQTCEINSLGNSLSTQYRIEKEENCSDYRSTPKIFAAAMRGVGPAPRTS